MADMLYDEIRPSSRHFTEVYEDAFALWSRLHRWAVEHPTLPPAYLSPLTLCRQYPYFPPNLEMNRYIPTEEGSLPRLYVTGDSKWGPGSCNVENGFAPFQQTVKILVAIHKPIPLTIADPTGEDVGQNPWFVVSNSNYVPILALAWAYILSARWTELFPDHFSLRYTDSQAKHGGDGDDGDDGSEHAPNKHATYFNPGDVAPQEARWWAAVLAPGRGWQAATSDGQHMSRWSVSLENHRFIMETANIHHRLPIDSPAASFETALLYLDRFCQRHNVIDQSFAALAAVLVLPYCNLHPGFRFHLPCPKQIAADELDRSSFNTPARRPQIFNGCQHLDWIHNDHHLDRLITMSCRAPSVGAMLLSAFFEPGVWCEVVAPWLQGTLAAFDVASQSGPQAIARMIMEREPSVAFLWVGVTILGLHETLLKEVEQGYLHIDLESAIWSGTTQSFLQLPLHDPHVEEDCMGQSFECQLLFLSQSGLHARLIPSQWTPADVTPLKDLSPEIRAHADCPHHRLEMLGFTWDCTGGVAEFQSFDYQMDIGPRFSIPIPRNNRSDINYNYSRLNEENDEPSARATGLIGLWLRAYGWLPHEDRVFLHPWFVTILPDDRVVLPEGSQDTTYVNEGLLTPKGDDDDED
ncbi:hypothetical protein GGS20DRAFT_587991 [Poronia punctata]|nr:hypothetical protein GGS20DRAFT_587991 [Poronia punctata]